MQNASTLGCMSEVRRVNATLESVAQLIRSLENMILPKRNSELNEYLR